MDTKTPVLIEKYLKVKLFNLQKKIVKKEKILKGLIFTRKILVFQIKGILDELSLLQKEGSYIGEIVQPINKESVLVTINNEGKFLVNRLSYIDKSLVVVNARVGLRNDSFVIHKILPPKMDPLVSLMKVENVPLSTYEMIGGLDLQIEQIKEVIELPLKFPEIFDSLGVTQPKGVLLHGPPGTGKTLLARAVAHHSDCTFIRVSGSELVQKYIGEGSRMVREVFIMARDHSPSIIFMDEVDSIGSSRGNFGNSGGDSEVQRTMLELLNQLDGFSAHKNIKVLMATNRIDVLDPALIRPGRIDRKIKVPNPNTEGRLAILKIHLKKVRVEPGIDLWDLAKNIPETSGAEIKSICMESGMLAVRELRGSVTTEDFNCAIFKVTKKKVNNFSKIRSLFSI
mmetsp:Transcript_61249/g.126514  ORF Transcript_61249/g.126514 Transcript_61249/m.126514 type:complete len:398 (-) Transcript_61249:1401-2594(-)